MSWSDLAWPPVAGLPVPHATGKPSRPLLAPALVAQMEARRERAVRGMAWLVTLALAVALYHVFVLGQTAPVQWVTVGVIEAGVLAGILFLRRRMTGADLVPEQRIQWQRYCHWQREHTAWLAEARQTYRASLTPVQRQRLAEAVAHAERQVLSHKRSQV
jgi:hypothetical protein